MRSVSGQVVRFKFPGAKKLCARVGVKAVACLAFVYPLFHAHVLLSGNVPPYRRGFFCDDESLKHPVIEETISVGRCVLIWVATVAAALGVVEGALFAVYKYPDREKSILRYDEPHRKNLVAKIPYVAIELARILGHFLLGALATLLTTEMAKYKVGRLRPYFLTLCGVRLTKELCEDEDGFQRFVTDYACSGDPGDIREARKSFLSGHSSFSFYCATFLVIYLQARLRRHHSQRTKKPNRKLPRLVLKFLKTVRPFLQFAFFMLALFISISRISDYKHHPLDVAVGIAVGVVFALIVLLIVVDLFRRPLAFYWEMTEEEALYLEVKTSMTDKILGNHSKDDIDFPSSGEDDPRPLISQTALHLPDPGLRSVEVKMGHLPVKSEAQTFYCSNTKLTSLPRALLTSEPRPSTVLNRPPFTA